MITANRRRTVTGWSVVVFAIAFALNAVWEMAQAPRYQSTMWTAGRTTAGRA